MVDTTQTTTEKKLTQSDIRGVFLVLTSSRVHGTRTYAALGSASLWYQQFVALPENNEARKQAIAVTWSSLTPVRGCSDLGVTLALEEQR